MREVIVISSVITNGNQLKTALKGQKESNSANNPRRFKSVQTQNNNPALGENKTCLDIYHLYSITVLASEALVCFDFNFVDI